MALADLLLVGRPDDALWQRAGAAMRAVDSLVHGFLARTGSLARLGAEHAYGPACYGPSGRASLLEGLATRIDAREFGTGLPAYFPRFVQFAIWHFCAQDGRDICNGNRIDDRRLHEPVLPGLSALRQAGTKWCAIARHLREVRRQLASVAGAAAGLLHPVL